MEKCLDMSRQIFLWFMLKSNYLSKIRKKIKKPNILLKTQFLMIFLQKVFGNFLSSSTRNELGLLIGLLLVSYVKKTYNFVNKQIIKNKQKYGRK